MDSGFSFTCLLDELEFGNAGFWGEGKTGVPGENHFMAKKKTNIEQETQRRRDLNPAGHIAGRRALPPLRHPRSPKIETKSQTSNNT